MADTSTQPDYQPGGFSSAWDIGDTDSTPVEREQEASVEEAAPATEEAPAEEQPEQTDTPAEEETDDAGETYKLKVNGKTIEVSQDELRAAAEKHYAAEDRLGEVKELQRKLRADEARVRQVETNVKKIFTDMPKASADELWSFLEDHVGVNMERIFLEWADKQYAYFKLPEADKMRLKAEKELNRYRMQDQKRLNAQKQAEYEQSVNRMVAQLSQDLKPAFAEAGLPMTPSLQKQALQLWGAALQRGMQPTARDVVDEVLAQRKAEALDDLRALSGKDLIAQLGKDKVKDIYRELEKGKPKPVARRENLPNRVSPQKGTQYVRSKDW